MFTLLLPLSLFSVCVFSSSLAIFTNDIFMSLSSVGNDPTSDCRMRFANDVILAIIDAFFVRLRHTMIAEPHECVYGCKIAKIYTKTVFIYECGCWMWLRGEGEWDFLSVSVSFLSCGKSSFWFRSIFAARVRFKFMLRFNVFLINLSISISI